MKPKCKYCGSEEVRVDAWAEWDNEKRDWVLAEVFEYEYCVFCEGETKLKWEE